MIDQLATLADWETYEDSFMGRHYPLDSHPELRDYLRQQLDLYGFKLVEGATAGVAVPPGMFELQLHNASVRPHEDDIPRGLYFALCVCNSEEPARDTLRNKEMGETENEFAFYDSRGRKHIADLHPGTVCVFNPRRTHSVTFYGNRDTLALVTVQRKR